MRLISKAFQSPFPILYKSSTAQEQLIFFFLPVHCCSPVCVTSVCSHNSVPASCVCTLLSHPVIGINGLSHFLSQEIQGANHAPLEAKYLPLSRLVLEQGSSAVFCHQVLLCGENQISYSWTVRDYSHSKYLQQTPIFEWHFVKGFLIILVLECVYRLTCQLWGNFSDKSLWL